MPKKRSRGRWFFRGVGCGMLLFLLLIAATIAYMRWEANLLPVTHTEIRSDEWTLPPIKTVVAADFHVGPGPEAQERLRRTVDKINAEKPDLILLPGDFVKGIRPSHSSPPAEIVKELSRLKAPLGVYAVLGNHETWHGTKEITRAFAEANIPLLENRRIELEFHGGKFHLIGASDGTERSAEEWNELLPADGLPRIVMTHNPDVYATLPGPAALAVAGHTHGGQIVIPLYGPVIPPSRFGKRYVSGVVREARNTIFITRGVGTSILPIRLFCPPEISVVTLSGKPPVIPEPVVPSPSPAP